MMTNDKRQMTDDFDLLLGWGLTVETDVYGERPASVPRPLQILHAANWTELTTELWEVST
jgi:hypothetical protein